LDFAQQGRVHQAARRLAGWGAEVAVFTSYQLDQARGLSARQIEIATGAGVGVESWVVSEYDDDSDPSQVEEVEAEDEVSADASDLRDYDLVIDALLGFGANGPPRPPVAEMIEAANESGALILALDVPSGLDAATGEAATPCVEARATVTLALPKTGLLVDTGRKHVGLLYLADIGVPWPLLADLGIEAEGLFAEDDIMILG